MPELPDIEAYLEALRPRIVSETMLGVRLAGRFHLRSVDPPLSAVAGRLVAGRTAPIRTPGRKLPTATCDKGAAAHGGEAMASVVDAWLVDRGGRELLENLGGRRPVRIEVKVRGAPAERRSRWFCRPERAIGVGI